jgi:hypothetical protein
VTATPTQENRPADQPDTAPAQPPRELAQAVDVAREAALAEAGADRVGAHVGVVGEDSAAATHLFTAEHPGYRGWHWAVTVAWAGEGSPVTVSEVVLLPGPDALVAPAWLPWQERVRAGDLGVGDLLPAPVDDPRLVPGYLDSGDPAVAEVALEIGFGRRRVLSREGRLDAASRWHGGDFGPRSDMARSAPGTCGTCGFYVQVAGSLGAAFGICANELTPADGHVVHVEYGCGAHSEVVVDPAPLVPVAELVYDDAVLEVEITPREPAAEETVVEEAPADELAADEGEAGEATKGAAVAEVAAEAVPGAAGVGAAGTDGVETARETGE